MADDGYLIGYEDGSGNFVEVGRLNNDAQDVTQPLTLKHQDSSNSLSIDGSGADFGGQDITGAGSVSTGDVNAELWPEPGDDLINYVGDDTTIKLHPQEEYVLSAPIGNQKGLVIKGSGQKNRRLGNQAHITYTGSTGTDSRVVDWGDPQTAVDGCHLENLFIDAGGAEYGVFLRYFTSDSNIRDVTVNNTTVAAWDVSKSWYGQLRRPIATKGNTGDGFNIHTTDGQIYGMVIDSPRVNLGGSGSGRGMYVNGGVAIYSPTVEQTGNTAIEQEGGQMPLIAYPHIEGYAKDQSTAQGIRVRDGVAILGGFYSGPSGSARSILVDAGAKGGVIFPTFIGDPDFHIRSNSENFVMIAPWSQNAGGDIYSEGLILQPFSGGTITGVQLRAVGGELETEDKAGNTTTLS